MEEILEQKIEKIYQTFMTDYKINKDRLRNIKKSKTKLKLLNEQLKILRKLEEFVLKVSEASQEEIKEYLENIGTLGLKTIYGDNNSLSINIDNKRHNQSISFLLSEGEHLYDPRDNTVAGGKMDIMSLSQKIGIASLDPSFVKVMIFDEPLKNLGSLSVLGGEILKELNRELGIQMIINTHDESLADIADTIIRIGENNE